MTRAIQTAEQIAARMTEGRAPLTAGERSVLAHAGLLRRRGARHDRRMDLDTIPADTMREIVGAPPRQYVRSDRHRERESAVGADLPQRLPLEQPVSWKWSPKYQRMVVCEIDGSPLRPPAPPTNKGATPSERPEPRPGEGRGKYEARLRQWNQEQIRGAWANTEEVDEHGWTDEFRDRWLEQSEGSVDVESEPEPEPEARDRESELIRRAAAVARDRSTTLASALAANLKAGFTMEQACTAYLAEVAEQDGRPRDEEAITWNDLEQESDDE